MCELPRQKPKKRLAPGVPHTVEVTGSSPVTPTGPNFSRNQELRYLPMVGSAANPGRHLRLFNDRGAHAEVYFSSAEARLPQGQRPSCGEILWQSPLPHGTLTVWGLKHSSRSALPGPCRWRRGRSPGRRSSPRRRRPRGRHAPSSRRSGPPSGSPPRFSANRRS